MIRLERFRWWHIAEVLPIEEDLFGDEKWSPGMLWNELAQRHYCIVAIDEDSLQRLGSWPWPRALHAALIDRLRAAGARAIAYDVLFVEPSPTDEKLGKAMRRGPPRILESVPPDLTEQRRKAG